MSQEVGNQLNTGYECEACGAKIISSLDSEKVACPSCGHVNKCTPKLVAAVRPATPEVPHSEQALCKHCQKAIERRPDTVIPGGWRHVELTGGAKCGFAPEPLSAPAAPDAAARLA